MMQVPILSVGQQPFRLTEFPTHPLKCNEVFRQEEIVRSHTSLSITIGAVLLLTFGGPVSASPTTSDACSLLTQTQVSGVLGVSVNAGVHSTGDPAITQLNCQWLQSAPSASNSKRVSVDIFGAVQNRTPADRFESAKSAVRGVTQTPVSGVGDEAFYNESRVNTILYVKKGSFVFQIIVVGYPADQVKPLEKTLAQAVISKL
jgi:hypothetical protein